MDNRAAKGFTLLELMITVVMLAALVIVSFYVFQVVGASAFYRYVFHGLALNSGVAPIKYYRGLIGIQMSCKSRCQPVYQQLRGRFPVEAYHPPGSRGLSRAERSLKPS